MMWNEKIKRDILNEAVRIGDELLLIGESDESGLSWKTMGVDKDMKVTSFKWENIFSGVSGIVLFFLELYRKTQTGTYLNAAVNGIRWVENHCKHDPSDFYSFFNGRMGVSYALLKTFEVTKASHYLDNALKMAQPCLNFFDDSRMVSNLLNGAAGTLLGLMHLHAASGEEWLLEKIDRFVKYLVENTHPGPKGIYWDRNSQNISGVCGFSHGAAGIGFTLLELGHYFGNEAFYWLAEQAFLYESCFYDKEKKNWPDLKKGIQKYEDYTAHENAFREGKLDFFTKGNDVNTWMQGAVGIGLSRLRACEILNKPVYEQEVKNAIEKTIQTENAPGEASSLFTPGNGRAGCAELFLESYKTLKEPKYLTPAQKIALQALAFQKEHGVYLSAHRYTGKEGNSSLFMGNPGIGYFYLRILDPLTVPSILMPKINAVREKNPLTRQYPYITISLPGIKKIVLNKYFNRSTAVAEELFPRKLERFFNQKIPGDRELLKEDFVRFTGSIIPTLPRKEKECISDIREIESEKMRMDEAVTSHYLLFIKERVRRSRMEKRKYMEISQILELHLVLETGIRLRAAAWDWNLTAGRDEWIKNLQKGPDFYPLLLKALPEGVVEIPLSPFTYAVLVPFREVRRVRDIIPEIIESFEISSDEKKELLTTKIIEQIKETFFAGFLVEPTTGSAD